MTYFNFDSDGTRGDTLTVNAPGGQYGYYGTTGSVYGQGGATWRGLDQITFPFQITRVWATFAADLSAASKYQVDGGLYFDPGGAFIAASGYPPNQGVPAGNMTPQRTMMLCEIWKNWQKDGDQVFWVEDVSSQGLVMDTGDALYTNIEFSANVPGLTATIYWGIRGQTIA